MMQAATRKIATRGGDGTIRLEEDTLPALTAGTVQIRVHASLVSPGTELNGWQGYAEKRARPDAAEKRSPFGYSNAGVVEAVGEGAADFKVGDRVACIGAGFALHADRVVVPHNLCVPLPAAVSYEQGSYAMLMATAMHALRRGEPDLGESVAVVGLGIVGLLTARLYQVAGCYPIGWELNAFRREKADAWGIPANNGDVAATRAFSGGDGLDAAVLANHGPCDATVDALVECMKVSPDGHAMGKIMVVGLPVYSSGGRIGGMNNLDVRRCSRTGFGYHDSAWEKGTDYPRVAMRWTTRTNLLLCMRLLAEKKVDVDALTTHRIPLDTIEEGIAKAMKDPATMLGVIFLPRV